MGLSFFHSRAAEGSIFVSLFVFLLQSHLYGQEKGPEGSPQWVLNQVNRVYATCKSYRDQGVIQSIYLSNKSGIPPTEHSTYFSTFFVRPDAIRFECQLEGRYRKPGPYIVWSRGGSIRAGLIGDQSEMLKGQSFSSYLGGMAAISDGVSIGVPLLLLPDELPQAHRLTELRNVQIDSGAKIDSQETYCIKGSDFLEHRYRVWIAKQNFLIHKIEEEFADTKGESKSITTYQPAIDSEITDKMLAFERNDENTPLGFKPTSWFKSIAIGIAIILISAVTLGIFILARRKVRQGR